MRMIEVQDRFAMELAASMTSRWESIQVHYENMTSGGMDNEVFQAFYCVGEVKNQFNLGIELLDTLLELKKNQPSGQVAEWTWFEFEMDNSGKYKFDYKYGMPPLIAIKLKYSD